MKKLKSLLQSNSILHSAPGHSFLLASGATSHVYIDIRKTSLLPQGQRLLGKHLYHFTKSFPKVDAIIGVPFGGLPLATAISYFSHKHHPLPSLFLRKESKSYGTSQMIEGNYIPGMKVLVIEDVITSGKSSLEAIEKIQMAKLSVEGVICVLDREEGGVDKIKDTAKIPVISLFKLSQFVPSSEIANRS